MSGKSWEKLGKRLETHRNTGKQAETIFGDLGETFGNVHTVILDIFGDFRTVFCSSWSKPKLTTSPKFKLTTSQILKTEVDQGSKNFWKNLKIFP